MDNQRRFFADHKGGKLDEEFGFVGPLCNADRVLGGMSVFSWR
jgi:hypothetical protein